MPSRALFKRLRAAEEWLRWLAAEERVLLGQQAPVTSRRLRAVDATVVSEPGSTGTDWRIHYAINLTSLQCDFFELTDVTGGETWRRFPVEAGDILLGDRVYANPPGVAHVLAAQGEVVVNVDHARALARSPRDAGRGAGPSQSLCGGRARIVWGEAIPGPSPGQSRLKSRLKRFCRFQPRRCMHFSKRSGASSPDWSSVSSLQIRVVSSKRA